MHSFKTDCQRTLFFFRNLGNIDQSSITNGPFSFVEAKGFHPHNHPPLEAFRVAKVPTKEERIERRRRFMEAKAAKSQNKTPLRTRTKRISRASKRINYKNKDHDDYTEDDVDDDEENDNDDEGDDDDDDLTSLSSSDEDDEIEWIKTVFNGKDEDVKLELEQTEMVDHKRYRQSPSESDSNSKDDQNDREEVLEQKLKESEQRNEDLQYKLGELQEEMKRLGFEFDKMKNDRSSDEQRIKSIEHERDSYKEKFMNLKLVMTEKMELEEAERAHQEKRRKLDNLLKQMKY
ncbi:uncharacterized protein L201_005740 [Kwoniella dendrophila CBS 6074]|uniref:Uncharacterized protein n=1 Tax=Kwoniella dendrophila CBS 6074 TaxID=1295534 RepID=A0AAX4K0Y5_9TREE